MKPKLRYSLTSFLIVFTGIAVWFGFLTSSAARQRRAVAVLQRAGGDIYYDWMLEPVYDASGGIDYYKVIRDPSAIGAPQWLRQLLGDDYFQSVVKVSSLEPDDLNDENVYAALTELPRIRDITLTSGPNDDRGQIDELKTRIHDELGVVVSGPFSRR